MITTDTLNILIIADLFFTGATFMFFYLYSASGKKTFADIVSGVMSILISGYLAIGQGAGTFKSEILGVIVQDNGLAYLFGAWTLFMIIMTMLFGLKEITDRQGEGF